MGHPNGEAAGAVGKIVRTGMRRAANVAVLKIARRERRPARGRTRFAIEGPSWIATLQFGQALLKMLDALWLSVKRGAYVFDNAAGRPGPTPVVNEERLHLVVVTDMFPALSETFVANEVSALIEAGHAVRVEASGRPPGPQLAASRGLSVRYLEDDGMAQRALDLTWVIARHPWRCWSDLRSRRRWAAEESVWPLRAIASFARRLAARGEQHLHVHFAASSALNTMRVARLTGRTYSVAAHAYDIFSAPANLHEKLSNAALVATDCQYNVAHLRTLLGPAAGARVHEIVLGVDTERFRRTTPHPERGIVLAVGRLVEKKGFSDLIAATARLPAERRPEEVVIVGDGQLRPQLESQAKAAGLEQVVSLVGWRDPDSVRELLEEAALLVMPCVVASNGDRDSMPVAVKEALAMEVPIVATAEVGLPELVKREFGRLVPPHDPDALAQAMAVVLAQPVDSRAAMGRAGRRFVSEHCDLHKETAKLAGLISRHSGDGPRRVKRWWLVR